MLSRRPKPCQTPGPSFTWRTSRPNPAFVTGMNQPAVPMDPLSFKNMKNAGETNNKQHGQRSARQNKMQPVLQVLMTHFFLP